MCLFKESVMASKIVFSPPLPSAIMDLARGMIPEGYDLHIIDQSSPDFLSASPANPWGPLFTVPRPSLNSCN
jgi:hypothetical protein